MSWEQSTREREQMTRITEDITGRIFCTSCQTSKPPEGGKTKITANGRRRFVCAGCVARWRSYQK